MPPPRSPWRAACTPRSAPIAGCPAPSNSSSTEPRSRTSTSTTRPTLFFEYIARMGHVIDQLGLPGRAAHGAAPGRGGADDSALHRGDPARARGSRCSSSSRSSSSWCGGSCRCPRGASIRVRYGDARETLGETARGVARVGRRARGRRVRRRAHPGARHQRRVLPGVRGLPRARRRAARQRRRRLGAAFARGPGGDARSDVLAGRRRARRDAGAARAGGSATSCSSASAAPLPLEWMPRLLAGGPHPATVVHDRELRDWIAGAPVVTDATAVPSPPPTRSVFQTAARRFTRRKPAARE